MTTLIVIVALLLDRIFAELQRWHPLVGFGCLVKIIEKKLWRADCSHSQTYLRGIAGLVLLLLPPVFITILLTQNLINEYLINTLLLYFAIGSRSLSEHAMQVYFALKENNHSKAQILTAKLVSRDTQELNEMQLSKATIESVLENGCDAIFGAIFWYIVAGAPGVVMYRIVNTLDAMWGYRNERYNHFGWAAARLDDVLNYIPSRLTALSYAVVGQFQNAIQCWYSQGSRWKSPNAGPVMAAGAGALSILLGGTATYHGERQQRPILGLDNNPQILDIERAVRLVNRSILLWMVVIVIGELLLTITQ